ncbi:hypothetical protein MGG_17351 [Pyricularia oryzae 70-15]|uniref:Uncharacterized protein n=4 Tax=Pyricularia oryzae TaxID=318829 RepID=G4NDR5_PYRO7|nr:uncharacterized protein MGG_17351 [Pyricularia oryzae 70-15]ELQ43860.1 hypothetical protein OOU_Y34scaffold00126g63 [Pyricularia oryzae Y34]KAI7923659.1 hypothetical protein M9X92_004269 [Pyricularia oryzae]EHA48503.1 hypothetical protein MGG_17351 [Pyricularia oryzae 70-15]KAI7925133.1 hypothetical protein M0657_004299 [Pyricularia oryzae]QBZ62325.1 hypothetical protein PoMZ_11204 [Pyricularia oryzae]
MESANHAVFDTASLGSGGARLDLSGQALDATVCALDRAFAGQAFYSGFVTSAIG